MATTVEEQLPAPQEQLNIETLVQEPTWKDILVELVKKNEIDPWNVDIIDIVDKYVSAIKQMKVMDLRVPANIILAASILLRLKGEMLSVEEIIEEPEMMEEHFAREPVQVDPLSLRLRFPPKRKISLVELVTALEEAMKLKEIKEQKAVQKPLDIPIKINSMDIEAEMNALYGKMKGIADSSNMLTFNLMLKSFKNDDVLLSLFIPMLFLAHRGKIDVIQEKFFGEIIISLNN